MNPFRSGRFVAFLLVPYLFLLGVSSALIIVFNFPTQAAGKLDFSDSTFGWVASLSPGQGLLLLAFVAGVAGSFLHAAQSLGTYLGNNRFKLTWTTWYLLRPWIGGVLGLAIYLSARAGLTGNFGEGDGVNPYGVTVIGLLGGWFSKTTTDKLQEVFDTLFKTTQDEHRNDKLNPRDDSTPPREEDAADENKP